MREVPNLPNFYAYCSTCDAFTRAVWSLLGTDRGATKNSPKGIYHDLVCQECHGIVVPVCEKRKD